MGSLHLLLIICIGLVVLYIYRRYENSNMCYVKSTFDSREYMVRNRKDKQNAADRVNAWASMATKGKIPNILDVS